MQTLSWYLNRLRSMGPGEIAWRLHGAVRDLADRCRITLGAVPSPARIRAALAAGCEPGFRVTDLTPGAWRQAAAHPDERAWCERLCRQADAIAAHRLSFLGLHGQHLGDPIDWHRDHASGVPAPRGLSQGIDYRDFRVTGDCKLVWEPNRHHQLVVLGRAWRATGEPRYAEALLAQLASWLDQNPFGRGMNWRSPLELGVRLINWVWALDLIHESGLFRGALRSRVLHAAYLHCWEIARKYSRGSSANNHLVGEAAGVFVAASYFRAFPGAGRWRDEAREILIREIERQTYPDGCTREQALGYQFFVLQFYLVAGLAARRAGGDFPPRYWQAIERMMAFIAALAEGGAPPLFGDSDDGYVLDLGDRVTDVPAVLATGAVLFGRADFKATGGGYRETTRWLLGRDSRTAYEAIADEGVAPRLASRAFPDSGYYLLQAGERGGRDRLSVLFDCGELGYGAIAAHGHADALSFTLRLGGTDVLVDPGTYDYFSFPAWRDYFRGTSAHNTVVIDGLDQSEKLGPFLWGARATARCLAWAPRPGGGRISAEHDGYARLADPVIHRRHLDLDGDRGEIEIRDEILARGAHEVALWFHLSEACTICEVSGNECRIALTTGQAVTLAVDPGLTVETLRGSESPAGGWLSRGYHQKVAVTTLVGRAAVRGPATFVSRIAIR